MTQQINGMVRERLINCATHFDNDQIEAIMQVVKDSGYSEMYEALKMLLFELGNPMEIPPYEIICLASKALAKAEGK